MKEPYGLASSFEELVLFYAASNPRFWARVGHVVDAESLAHPLAKLVFDTVRVIAKDIGHGPDSSVITIQRLSRKVYEGKVTAAQLDQVNDLIDRVLDLPPPDVDAVVDELLPVVKRRLYHHAILAAHDDWQKGGDFSLVETIFEKAKRLGEQELIRGTKLGPQGFAEIETMKLQDRLPLGVLELDMQLANGLPNGQLGVWIGDSGGGKSIALVHQAAESTKRQLFTGFVTLELPTAVQLARLYANLTGVPTNSILDNPADRAEAKRRMELLEPYIGICEIAEFPPHATSVKDLVEWIEQKEQEHGIAMQALVVDYADKLHDPRVRDNDYVAMRHVYEGLRRDIAVERKMWLWTGSQARRPDGKGKVIDLGHAADSMHKVRVADLVLTLNPKPDEEGMLDVFVAKNRMGKSRFTVGPLMTDFERGRLVPATRELLTW